MTWLHTWFGLVLGFVLMICFFFGALAVFDREIDRWAIPESRFDPQPMPSFDNLMLPILKQVQPDAKDYASNMPGMHDDSKGSMTPRLELPITEYWAYTTHRDPLLAMGVGFEVPYPKDPDAENHIYGRVTIDPRSGAQISDDALKIGSRWFYPMHYKLHFEWLDLGYWIVGLAGFTMLIALVSGVVMHRKLFKEFFTFRPHKQTLRSTLDLHNMTGVIALPFHFFFAITGLIIFASWLYYPNADTLLEPLSKQHEINEAAVTGLPAKPAGIEAPLASVDAMVAEAKRRWAARDMAGDVGYLTVTHVGDVNGYVSVYRAGRDRVAMLGEGIHFKASTGEVIREDPPPSMVAAINEFLTGLHLAHFEHWTLRWLYVLGGLLGCVCIATGFIFFVEKRKDKHAKLGSLGCRLVDALAVTTVTGMLIACIFMLLVNRLLPAETANKGDMEIWLFWIAWAAALIHALWRSAPGALARHNPAWREQCLAITVLGASAVIANWLSTGDHLIKTVLLDTYWPVAGVDLSLLASAWVAWLVAQKLSAQTSREAPIVATRVVHE